MKTKSEIVEFLEKELAEAEEMLEKYNCTDDEKATQYLIMSNQLNYILEEIEEPTQADKQAEESVAKVLVEMPKEQKPKKTPLEIYINIFTFVVFITSWFFVDGLIYDLVDEFEFLKGILSALLHFGYLLIHGLSYFLLVTHSQLLNINKSQK